MNLDELRSVQSKERSKDSLQHLRESFYSDVGEYIRGLREERERAAERAADPFDSAEVNQLTDEIQTAEEVVEAVYERRVGKVVKRASLAAAGIPADEEGLTSEEQMLFSDLVERIDSNKATVLDVLAGEEPSPGESSTVESGTTAGAEPEPEPNSESDDRPTAEAAAIADSDDTTEANRTTSSEPASPAPSAREPDPTATEADGNATVTPDSAEAHSSDDHSNGPATSASESESESDPDPDPEEESEPKLSADRTTVRITQDIGSILGVDEREYELTSEDVVALPTQNAGPLIERDAAEKLD